MSEELADFQRNIMNSIGRHFVSLRVKDLTLGDAANSHEGVGVPYNFSAFVIEIRGDWFLITAGHVLAMIAEARQAGKIIENFRLDDAYRPDARFKDWDALIPFDFDNAVKHFVDHPNIGDYAAIYLSPCYRDLLTVNNILPFSPREMGVPDAGTKYDAYWLIGLPKELMYVDGVGEETRHRSQIVIIRAEPMPFDHLPESVKLRIQDKGFRKDNLFARIPPADELRSGDELGLDSIVGVSGGPIIAWRRGTDGVFGYSVVAVQSTWWKADRIIMACPITRYVDALDHTIQAKLAQEGAEPTS